MHHESAIVAVHGSPRAARMVGRALQALRSVVPGTAGVVVAHGGTHRTWRPRDPTFLLDEPALDTLRGSVALGQVTAVPVSRAAEEVPGTGDPARRPVAGTTAVGPLAAALCGGFVNRGALRQRLLEQGALLSERDDLELLAHLIAMADQRTPVNRMVDALWQVKGGFSLAVLAGQTLVGVRDPRGLRTLVIGRVGEATVLASDTLALDALGARLVRGVAPGEMVIVGEGTLDTVTPFLPRPLAPCLLERLRLASEGSAWGGDSAWTLRIALGRALARELPCPEAHVVVAPEGHEAVAVGFAEVSGRPLVPALRTAPDRAVPEAVAGRTVVVVGPGGDDAETITGWVRHLTLAGAAAVHVRLGLPPTRTGCPYGVRVPVPGADQLAVVVDPDQLTQATGAASLAWTTDAVRRAALGDPEGGWCSGCLGGAWPEVAEGEGQLGLF